MRAQPALECARSRRDDFLVLNKMLEILPLDSYHARIAYVAAQIKDRGRGDETS